MKIASFCHFPQKKHLSGAQVPAVAFRDWCRLLGHDCDLLTLDPLFDMEMLLQGCTRIRDEAQLNEYDAVFFSTPETHMHFNFAKVEVPYSVMMHAEFDINTYGGHEWLSKVMKRARNIVVIEEGYWNFSADQLPWYPCCMPAYLIKDDSVRFKSNLRSGIIYSARLARCKNWELLAKLTTDTDFMYHAERADVYGYIDKPAVANRIDEISPRWLMHSSPYNVYDTGSVKERNERYKMFWDVFENKVHPIHMRRLNLSAVEGIGSGLIPIVNTKTAPPVINSFAIDYRDVCDDPQSAFDFDYEERSADMVKILHDHQTYNYNAVKSQVMQIIEGLA